MPNFKKHRLLDDASFCSLDNQIYRKGIPG